MDRIVLESIRIPFKQHGLDTKWPQKVSEESWGSRGRRFKSCHSDQVWTMKMLYRPQSQCFQRLSGPRMKKSEGRQFLLFASRCPKPTRLAPTRPQFIAQPSQRPFARQQNSFVAFRAVPLAHPGRRGGVFLYPFCLPGQCQPPGAESQ